MFNEETTIVTVERWDTILGAWMIVSDVEEGQDPEALVAESRRSYDDESMGETAQYRLVTTIYKPIGA